MSKKKAKRKAKDQGHATDPKTVRLAPSDEPTSVTPKLPVKETPPEELTEFLVSVDLVIDLGQVFSGLRSDYKMPPALATSGSDEASLSLSTPSKTPPVPAKPINLEGALKNLKRWLADIPPADFSYKSISEPLETFELAEQPKRGSIKFTERLKPFPPIEYLDLAAEKPQPKLQLIEELSRLKKDPVKFAHTL